MKSAYRNGSTEHYNTYTETQFILYYELFGEIWLKHSKPSVPRPMIRIILRSIMYCCLTKKTNMPLKVGRL